MGKESIQNKSETASGARTEVRGGFPRVWAERDRQTEEQTEREQKLISPGYSSHSDAMEKARQENESQLGTRIV